MPVGPPAFGAVLALVLVALEFVVALGGAGAVVVVVLSEFAVPGFELLYEQLFRLKANNSRASRVRVLRIIMSPLSDGVSVFCRAFRASRGPCASGERSTFRLALAAQAGLKGKASIDAATWYCC